MKRIYYKVNAYIDFRDDTLPMDSIWTSDELMEEYELTKNDIVAMVDIGWLRPLKIDSNNTYWVFGARFILDETEVTQ